MTTTSNTTMNHKRTASTEVYDHQTRSLASKVGRFILHLLEMLVAMFAGMAIFHPLANLIHASSSYGELFASGTTLHTIGMTLFMTVPMLAWMIFRGHGWRHSVEMGIAMLAPMAAVGLLCQLGVDEYLPWLASASSPAMFLGMIVAMLYRRDHYTGHSGHAALPKSENVCH